MKNHTLIESASLTFNPFLPDLPHSALYQGAWMERELWRFENLARTGGFGALIGEPGIGKSVFMRHLGHQLGEIGDLQIASMDRPQSTLADFYRELSELFSIELRTSNRWGGFQRLREQWAQHLETRLLRPVLLIDETQSMQTVTLSELRLLSSDKFDSRRLLTVIMAGDSRFLHRLRSPDLVPLASRINPLVTIPPYSAKEQHQLLKHLLTRAGNPTLMSENVIELIITSCSGNVRFMMHRCHELLLTAARLKSTSIDETVYYEAFETNQRRSKEEAQR